MERVRNVELLSRLVARDIYRNDSESATVKFDVMQKTVRWLYQREERLLMVNHDMQFFYNLQGKAIVFKPLTVKLR